MQAVLVWQLQWDSGKFEYSWQPNLTVQSSDMQKGWTFLPFLEKSADEKRIAQSEVQNSYIDAEMVDRFHWTHQVHCWGCCSSFSRRKKREQILRAICCCPLASLLSVSSRISAHQMTNAQIISFQEIIYHSLDSWYMKILHRVLNKSHTCGNYEANNKLTQPHFCASYTEECLGYVPDAPTDNDAQT